MKIGNLLVNTAYLGSKVLTAIAVGATKLWEAVKYIVFKDPVVEQICATNWGDGERITPEQAAKVTNIGTVFKGNTDIITFPEFAYFTGITKTPYYGFQSCSNITSIVIPNSVSVIDTGTFHKCTNLRDITIPSSVKKVGGNAFQNCIILNIYVDNIDSFLSIDFSISNSMMSKAADGAHIYENGNLVTKITIPTSVTSVFNSQFYRYVDMTEITLHDGITSIAGYAFDDCTSAKINMNLSNLTSIGSNAFRRVKEIEDINLPNLTSLNNAAFWGSGVKKVSNLGKITNLAGGQWSQDGVFNGCTNLVSVLLPDCLESITNESNGYSNCFSGCTALENININHVKTIGKSCFSKCSSLSIHIDNPYLTVLDNTVFYSCGEITINTPNVTQVGVECFWNSKLKGILNMPNVESIGKRAFNSTNIEKVILQKIKTIQGDSTWSDHGAFYKCLKLTHVTLSDCVEFILNGAFYACSALTTILLPTATVPEIGNNPFPTTCSIYVPDSAIDEYKTVWSKYASQIKPLSDYKEE